MCCRHKAAAAAVDQLLSSIVTNRSDTDQHHGHACWWVCMCVSAEGAWTQGWRSYILADSWLDGGTCRGMCSSYRCLRKPTRSQPSCQCHDPLQHPPICATIIIIVWIWSVHRWSQTHCSSERHLNRTESFRACHRWTRRCPLLQQEMCYIHYILSHNTEISKRVQFWVLLLPCFAQDLNISCFQAWFSGFSASFSFPAHLSDTCWTSLFKDVYSFSSFSHPPLSLTSSLSSFLHSTLPSSPSFSCYLICFSFLASIFLQIEGVCSSSLSVKSLLKTLEISFLPTNTLKPDAER